MAAIPIRINIDGIVISSDRAKHVSKANDTVQFISQGGGPWTVSFDKPGKPGSPFAAASYTTPAAGPVSAGPATGGIEGQFYSYNVKHAAGAITDDPDVLIDG